MKTTLLTMAMAVVMVTAPVGVMATAMAGVMVAATAMVTAQAMAMVMVTAPVGVMVAAVAVVMAGATVGATVPVVAGAMAAVMVDAVNVIEDTLEYIYTTVDRWLHEGRFKFCDRLLARLKVDTVETVCLLALLSITSAARDQLRQRADFAQRVKQCLINRLGKEQAQDLLRGIE